MQNLVRVDRVPIVLAGLVLALAVAALGHLLVLTVSSNRGQLAVLKSIGFTRRQVSTAVAWYASTLAVVSLVLGVFAGVIMGYSIWTAVVDRIGVIAPPRVPLTAVAAIASTTFLVVNVVAAVPGIRAGRVSAAAELRRE